MQIKTIIRYHLTPVRVANINKLTTKKNAIQDVNKRESSFTVGGNINWYNHYEKEYGGNSES